MHLEPDSTIESNPKSAFQPAAGKSAAKAVALTIGLGVWLGGILMSSGCGGGEQPAATGSEKFEAERKAYQDIRRKEYGRANLEPGKDKGKGKTARKKG